MTLIPIGQFSEMTRLSSKALRLYDKSGLLPPAHVDQETGYRYYDLSQANRAEAVRMLRSVDMPLEEIKAVLVADNPDQVHKQLNVHRERLASRLSDDEQKLSYLEALMNRTDGIMPYTINVEQASSQLIAATRLHTSLADIADDIAAGFTQLVQALSSTGIAPAGPPFIIYHDVIDEETDGDIEVCIPIATPLPDRNGNVYAREFEGGNVVTTVHQGRYEEIAPAYHTLTGWISEHNHEMAGPPREIYLNDPQTVPPDDLQTRLEFPITRTSA